MNTLRLELECSTQQELSLTMTVNKQIVKRYSIAQACMTEKQIYNALLVT